MTYNEFGGTLNFAQLNMVSFGMYLFDIIRALHAIHDNPLAYDTGFFVIFTL